MQATLYRLTPTVDYRAPAWYDDDELLFIPDELELIKWIKRTKREKHPQRLFVSKLRTTFRNKVIKRQVWHGISYTSILIKHDDLLNMRLLSRERTAAYKNTQTFSFKDNLGQLHQYKVQDIIDLTKRLTPQRFPLSKINPTGLNKLNKQRVNKANLKYPVIIDPDFSSKQNITAGIIDGMHRIAKAKQLDHSHIMVYFVNVDNIKEHTASTHEFNKRYTRNKRKHRQRQQHRWNSVKHLPTTTINVKSLYDEYYHKKVWSKHTLSPADIEHGNAPPFELYQHRRAIKEANLKFPLIIQDDRLIDGVHRLIKAKQLNRKTLKAVRFEKANKMNTKTATPGDIADGWGYQVRYEIARLKLSPTHWLQATVQVNLELPEGHNKPQPLHLTIDLATTSELNTHSIRSSTTLWEDPSAGSINVPDWSVLGDNDGWEEQDWKEYNNLVWKALKPQLKPYKSKLQARMKRISKDFQKVLPSNSLPSQWAQWAISLTHPSKKTWGLTYSKLYTVRGKQKGKELKQVLLKTYWGKPKPTHTKFLIIDKDKAIKIAEALLKSKLAKGYTWDYQQKSLLGRLLARTFNQSVFKQVPSQLKQVLTTNTRSANTDSGRISKKNPGDDTGTGENTLRTGENTLGTSNQDESTTEGVVIRGQRDNVESPQKGGLFAGVGEFVFESSEMDRSGLQRNAANMPLVQPDQHGKLNVGADKPTELSASRYQTRKRFGRLIPKWTKEAIHQAKLKTKDEIASYVKQKMDAEISKDASSIAGARKANVGATKPTEKSAAIIRLEDLERDYPLPLIDEEKSASVNLSPRQKQQLLRRLLELKKQWNDKVFRELGLISEPVQFDVAQWINTKGIRYTQRRGIDWIIRHRKLQEHSGETTASVNLRYQLEQLKAKVFTAPNRLEVLVPPANAQVAMNLVQGTNQYKFVKMIHSGQGTRLYFAKTSMHEAEHLANKLIDHGEVPLAVELIRLASIHDQVVIARAKLQELRLEVNRRMAYEHDPMLEKINSLLDEAPISSTSLIHAEKLLTNISKRVRRTINPELVTFARRIKKAQKKWPVYVGYPPPVKRAVHLLKMIQNGERPTKREFIDANQALLKMITETDESEKYDKSRKGFDKLDPSVRRNKLLAYAAILTIALAGSYTLWLIFEKRLKKSGGRLWQAFENWKEKVQGTQDWKPGKKLSFDSANELAKELAKLPKEDQKRYLLLAKESRQSQKTSWSIGTPDYLKEIKQFFKRKGFKEDKWQPSFFAEVLPNTFMISKPTPNYQGKKTTSVKWISKTEFNSRYKMNDCITELDVYDPTHYEGGPGAATRSQTGELEIFKLPDGKIQMYGSALMNKHRKPFALSELTAALHDEYVAQFKANLKLHKDEIRNCRKLIKKEQVLEKKRPDDDDDGDWIWGGELHSSFIEREKKEAALPFAKPVKTIKLKDFPSAIRNRFIRGAKKAVSSFKVKWNPKFANAKFVFVWASGDAGGQYIPKTGKIYLNLAVAYDAVPDPFIDADVIGKTQDWLYHEYTHFVQFKAGLAEMAGFFKRFAYLMTKGLFKSFQETYHGSGIEQQAYAEQILYIMKAKGLTEDEAIDELLISYVAHILSLLGGPRNVIPMKNRREIAKAFVAEDRKKAVNLILQWREQELKRRYDNRLVRSIMRVINRPTESLARAMILKESDKIIEQVRKHKKNLQYHAHQPKKLTETSPMEFAANAS
jgi:hypothetical protein